MIRFTVPGPPQGKGRPRFTRSGRVYTPKKTADYETAIALAYKAGSGNFRFDRDSTVRVDIDAYYPIPKSDSKKKQAAKRANRIRPTVKPDADNLGKIVMDALNGLAYDDDKQVTALHVAKYYSETPRIVIALQAEDPLLPEGQEDL